jgi:hypothetical protein
MKIVTLMGRILVMACIKAGVATERTSVNYYYSVDDVLKEINRHSGKSKKVCSFGNARVFDALFKNIGKLSAKKRIILDRDTAVDQIPVGERFILMLSDHGEGTAFLESIESRLIQADIVLVSVSLHVINEHKCDHFNLLRYLKSRGFSCLKILGGSQESYWQPVQDYAGLLLVATRNS